MDGHFQNKDHEHERTIESWMVTIIQDGGVTRYDDLHIDRIDDEWKLPGLWVPAAFHAHELAVKIRDRNKLRFSVVLAFSLRAGEKRTGVDFNTREQLEARFNHTPPSLYLFRPGAEPWNRAKVTEVGAPTQYLVVQKMNSQIFGSLAALKDCWYLEFRHGNVEGYCRSVFVAEGLT